MTVKEVLQSSVLYFICLYVNFLFFEFWLLLLVLLSSFSRFFSFFAIHWFILLFVLLGVFLIANCWIVSIFSFLFIFNCWSALLGWDLDFLLWRLFLWLVIFSQLLSKYFIVLYKQWLHIHFQTVFLSHPFIKNWFFNKEKFVYLQVKINNFFILNAENVWILKSLLLFLECFMVFVDLSFKFIKALRIF